MTTAYRTSAEAAVEPVELLPPIDGLDAYFPRAHPSAGTVRLLGLLALVTGPIAGIPAILLGRVVDQESARSNGRIIAAPRGFTQAGWAGTYAGLLLLLYLFASVSIAFSMVLVCAGAAAALALIVGSAPRAPSFLSAWNRFVRRAPALVGVPVAGVLLAGAAGYVSKRGVDERARMEAAQQCDASLHAFDGALAENKFVESRAQLSMARGVCTGAVLETLSGRAMTLDEREAADQKRREAEEGERRAREAAQAARLAEQQRADAAKEADMALRQAETSAAKGQWEVAEDQLQRADRALSSLRDLHAENGVLDPLHKRASVVRGRITPGLDQIRKVREAQAAAEERRRAAQEAAAAARQAAVERQSSRVLMCNDGTVSGCPCAGSHRGCCSHHHGVAGCQ